MEDKEVSFNTTYEVIGPVDAISHLATYMHEWLKQSNNADDYKDSKILINCDVAGTLTVVVWPNECKVIPPAWLMDYKMWRYFCKNVIDNFNRSKEDI